MQIKTTVKHHSHPLGWLLKKQKQKISADMDMEKLETLMHCWWECKMVQPLWKTIRQFLKKLELSYDTIIPLLGIFPKKLKAGTRTGICTLMFIAALFTIAKKWKHPKCPLTKK